MQGQYELHVVRLPIRGILAVGLDLRRFFPDAPGGFSEDGATLRRINAKRAEHGFVLVATGDLLSMNVLENGGFVVGHDLYDPSEDEDASMIPRPMPGTRVPLGVDMGAGHWWCFADDTERLLEGERVARLEVTPGVYEFVLHCLEDDWCGDESHVFITIRRIGDI